MKFRQEFTIHETVAEVWKAFEQETRIAECIPGVEKVEVLDRETFSVRMTQKVGPMTATFESKVHVTERVPEQRIQFTSTGKAIKGAIGNFRATNTVSVHTVEHGTNIVVEADLALGGVLGSIGQKVVMGQAAKIATEFATNLERMFAADPADERA